MSEALSLKIQKFCHEYIVDNNATQAAIRAGYSKRTAKQQGSRLLTNVDVKEFIEALQKPIEKNLKINAEKVLQGIAELAFNGKTESTRANGLKMLGEHLKLFTQLHESTMTFKNMPTAKMKAKDGKEKLLDFDVGKPVKKKE